MAIDIQKLGALGARIGMGLAGNAKEAVVFHVGFTAGEYDPSTDTMTPDAGNNYPVDVLPYVNKNRQQQRGEVSERQFSTYTETLLVQVAQLGEAVDLSETDTVTRADGITWNIVNASRDPSRATWLVEVRR